MTITRLLKHPNLIFAIFLRSLFLLSVSSVANSAVADIRADHPHFFGGPVTEEQKRLLIEGVKNSSRQPPAEHPRLYGTNSDWYKTVELYNSLDPDCSWLGGNGIGTVKNIKRTYDRYSIGGETCGVGNRAVPSSLQENNTARQYLAGELDRWTNDSALNMVYLIRRMTHCHTVSTDCTYSATEIDALSQAFLTYEFNRLRNEPLNASGYVSRWHKGFSGSFFDLGAYPAFKLWTLILDTFWDSPYLLEDDKHFVQEKLAKEIDSYIEIYHLPSGSSGALGRWALHNGNNWTPILNAAALFWAITFWHDEQYADKARQVLDIVLESSWLHRDEYMDDGAYTEGPTYLGTSMKGSVEINQLLMGAFGQPNHAMKWGLMSEKTTKWMLDNVASDGRFIDFGDAWAKNGYAHLYIMDMLYWQELTGLTPIGSTVVDGCLLRQHFSSSYYLQAFYDIWQAFPHYARDFYSLSASCEVSQLEARTTIYPTYQMSTQRQYLPGATTATQGSGADVPLNQLVDQTFLAGNAVSNSLQHRELDFGAIIWTAFGNRLLSDWGYGTLSKPYDIYDVKGANGHYLASNQDYLEFYLKPIEGASDPSRLFVNLKTKGYSKELAVADYLSELEQGWQKVSIPLIDFGWSEQKWQGLRGGIEVIRFKTTGYVRDTEFGIDEIQFVSGTAEQPFVWYGDTHSESLESNNQVTPIISHQEALSITGVESSGGANGTDGWVRLAATGKYSTMEVFYKAEETDQYVINYMDRLAIGANTLILPKALDESSRQPASTNNSQFWGQTGQIHELEVDGLSAVHMNGSLVYGKYLANGHLDYFHRYLISLPNGNFAIADSFKTKQGKQDKVQEFWYSNKDLERPCYKKSSDVVQTISAQGHLLLTPRCNALLGSEVVESYGRIVAASTQDGYFKLGVPNFMANDRYFNRFVEDNGLYLMNRLNRKETRRLAHYTTDSEIEQDIRVFVLQSSPTAEFSEVSVTQQTCDTGVCFNIAMENAQDVSLNFAKVDGQYVLPNTDISLPEKTDEDSGDNDNQPEPDAPTKIGDLVTPLSFTVSHPQRVSDPMNLFDEQESLTVKPNHLSKNPEFNETRLTVNLSDSNRFPIRQAVETDSRYGRKIYVDESGNPVSVSIQVELEEVHSISEIMYYDMSSSYRPGKLLVWVSEDQQTWVKVYDDTTGHYKKWQSIPVTNLDVKFIKLEFPEENSARGISEVLIFGTPKMPPSPQLIQPIGVTSLHPGRVRDARSWFDEQVNLSNKPLHLAQTPILNATPIDTNLSNTNDLPMKLSVETDSAYGRFIYVDENSVPMPAEVVVSLDKAYMLHELMFYDMSSKFRPGKVVISASVDQQSWTKIHEMTTGEYKKWVSIPLTTPEYAQFLKIDLYEQNSARAMTEFLIYATEL
jgi:hypothetical protein